MSASSEEVSRLAWELLPNKKEISIKIETGKGNKMLGFFKKLDVIEINSGVERLLLSYQKYFVCVRVR